MTTTSRDELLRGPCRRHRDVAVNGSQFRIQSLTEREKSRFETALLSKSGGVAKARLQDATRRLLVLCLVDDDGHRLLEDGDVDALGDVDGAITSGLYTACREHCGFEEGDVEELAKNSHGLRVEPSPTV